MRSKAAESSRETVRMKGGQSKEVGSRESQSEGVEERREASARDVTGLKFIQVIYAIVSRTIRLPIVFVLAYFALFL